MKEKKDNQDKKEIQKNEVEAGKKTEIEKLEELTRQRDEFLAFAQRTRADFLNYKKEEAERIKNFVEYKKAEWILNFLPILDHFEQAKKEISKDNEKLPLVEGFFQIQKQLECLLEQQGLEEINTQIGKKFDPNFEETIESVGDNEKEEGTIIEVVQKGYKFQDRIVRPARVKISSRRPPNNQ